MFTGIIETQGKIKNKLFSGNNIDFRIECPYLLNQIKVDQSIAHNGVCLTVTELSEDTYVVTAIDETLKKTNLTELKVDDFVNLERSMQLNGRFDGHIVQGHVDQIAYCKSITEQNGSWVFKFCYDDLGNITVEKGSICVNGISLTVVNSGICEFSVAIIPYTFENTNIKFLRQGDTVNVEFDIIGKYLKKLAFTAYDNKNSLNSLL
jgi:riboflavin synthase